MLLATAADRIFGIGGPGRLTAREALAVATSKVATLTAEGFEVRPEFVPDVWALARHERSVTPLGVFDSREGEAVAAPTQSPVATNQLGLFGKLGATGVATTRI